jgi:conjugative transfer signal peptidase TraF
MNSALSTSSQPARTASAAIRRTPRWRWLAIAAGGVALLGASSLKPRPLLIWNGSNSAPTGLYSVRTDQRLARGDMVAATLAEPHRSLAAARRYLPSEVPLIKRIAAVSGDTVCAKGDHIIINQRRVAVRKRVDPQHRALPYWEGCIQLSARQYFLLMDKHPNSFDGRYFGITEAQNIIGKVRLLWPD